MKATLTMTVAGLALVTLVAGCGSSGKSNASGTTTPAPAGQTASAEVSPPDSGVATLTISGSSFGAPTMANPGEPIKVVNKDSVPHTVTSGSAFNVEVKAGGTASFTAPTTPGNYPLTCRFHPKMHGTLTVRGI
jgi:plastocyanin